MSKINNVVATLTLGLIDAKARIIDTAAKVASEMSSDMYRAEVLESAFSAIEHIDSIMNLNSEGGSE